MCQGPVVSVICLVYNHEKFIRKALESFVMQKTDFSFEVIVHDDASQDDSATIIREYEKKYPAIIKPIYQAENQYSKERGRVTRIVTGAVKGKYVAMCEGDDYWTDPLKLQRQVDILEQNENVSACFTNGDYINELDNTKKDYVSGLKEGVVPAQRIIEIGGSIYPTASLLFRNCMLNYRIFHEIPEMAGDEAMIYSLVMQGDIYYLNMKTCAYRRWSGGIYSSISNHNNKLVAHKAKDIVAYSKFDVFADFLFTSQVKKRIRENSLFIIIHSSQLKIKLEHIKYLNKSDYWILFKRLLSKLR